MLQYCSSGAVFAVVRWRLGDGEASRRRTVVRDKYPAVSVSIDTVAGTTLPYLITALRCGRYTVAWHVSRTCKRAQDSKRPFLDSFYGREIRGEL
jgi:hypothetical protein